MLPKDENYKSLNLLQYSAEDLKLKQFKTLALLAQEIESSYKPLEGMAPKKKSNFQQTQSMKRLLSGKTSHGPWSGELDVKPRRRIGWS